MLDITCRINKHLKMIGDAVGISRIITYTGRHSFASVLKHSESKYSFYLREFST